MGCRAHIQSNHLSHQSSHYELLGEPSWLNDKEREIFLKLRAAVEKALSPQDIFDFQNVADIACSMVENQRFKRAQVALINSPAVLADLLKLTFGDNPDKARQVALNYFGNDPKKAAIAAELVAEAGMTHLQIEGHAIVTQSDRLQSLDRLVQFRETSNDRRIKELKKRQRKRADNIEKKSGHKANALHRQDGRGKDVDVRPRRRRVESSYDN